MNSDSVAFGFSYEALKCTGYGATERVEEQDSSFQETKSMLRKSEVIPARSTAPICGWDRRSLHGQRTCRKL